MDAFPDSATELGPTCLSERNVPDRNFTMKMLKHRNTWILEKHSLGPVIVGIESWGGAGGGGGGGGGVGGGGGHVTCW